MEQQGARILLRQYKMICWQQNKWSYFLTTRRSWVQIKSVGQLRNYLKERYLLRSRKPRLTTLGIRCADHATPPIPKKVGTNFAKKRRPLGRYSSLAGQSHGVFFKPLAPFYKLIAEDGFDSSQILTTDFSAAVQVRRWVCDPLLRFSLGCGCASRNDRFS
jgi:hypothetical protein